MQHTVQRRVLLPCVEAWLTTAASEDNEDDEDEDDDEDDDEDGGKTRDDKQSRRGSSGRQSPGGSLNDDGIPLSAQVRFEFGRWSCSAMQHAHAWL